MHTKKKMQLMLAAVAVVGSSVVAAPARAAESAADVAELVSAAEAANGVAAGDRISAAPGIDQTQESPAVPIPGADLVVRIDDASSGAVSQQKDLAVLDGGDDLTYVVDSVDRTTTRFTAVIASDEAKDPQWTLEGAELVALPDGGVVALRGDTLLGVIEAPWAVDSAGESVPTRFVVEGDSLRQVVETSAETSFPVVADPTFKVYPGYTQVRLSWNETLAVTGTVASCTAALSRSTHWTGRALSLACGSFAGYGAIQVSGHKCLNINVIGAPPVLSTWWPNWRNC